VCECCGDDVATTHVREERTRYRRADGTTFWTNWNQQQYGHLKCVRQRIDSNASPAQSAVAARAAPKDDDGE
jgi:hypothetical protein